MSGDNTKLPKSTRAAVKNTALPQSQNNPQNKTTVANMPQFASTSTQSTTNTTNITKVNHSATPPNAPPHSTNSHGENSNSRSNIIVSPNLAQTQMPTETTANFMTTPTNLVFHSSAIGQSTNRLQDLFADQNLADAAKKQKQKKIRKKLFIASGIMIGILLLTLGGWGILASIEHKKALVAAEGTEYWSTNQSQTVLDQAQKIFNSNNSTNTTEDNETKTETNFSDSDEYFANIINEENNPATKAEKQLTQVEFYYQNNSPEKIIEAAEAIDLDNLTGNQFETLRALLILAYNYIEDEEKITYWENYEFSKPYIVTGYDEED